MQIARSYPRSGHSRYPGTRRLQIKKPDRVSIGLFASQRSHLTWLSTLRNQNTAKSDVQISHLQGVGFNKGPAGLYIIAHESSEHMVGGDSVFHRDLQHAPHFRIHGGFP